MSTTQSVNSIQNKFRPLAVFFFCLATSYLTILHFRFPVPTNDDLWFASILDQFTLSDFLTDRYLNWSSRLAIEAVLVFLSRMQPIWWRLADILIFLIYVLCGSSLFVPEKYENHLLFYPLVLFLFPYQHLHSAGYIATTLNYIWPVAFALLALIPLKKLCTGEKVSPNNYVWYLLCTTYACSAEQLCACLFASYLLVLGYLVITERKEILQRKNLPFVSLVFLLISIHLLFIALCPGNALRNAQEAAAGLPIFSEYRLFQKLALGLFHISSFTISNATCLFGILLSVVLLLLVILRKKGILSLLASLYCVLLQFLFGFLPTYLGGHGKIQAGHFLLLLQNKQLPSCGSIYSLGAIFLEAALDILFWAGLLYLLICLGESFADAAISSLLLLAGAASGILVGFSASIFASGERSLIPLICMLSFLLLRKGEVLSDELLALLQTEKKRRIMILLTFLTLFFLYACLLTVHRTGFFG